MLAYHLWRVVMSASTQNTFSMTLNAFNYSASTFSTPVNQSTSVGSMTIQIFPFSPHTLLFCIAFCCCFRMRLRQTLSSICSLHIHKVPMRRRRQADDRYKRIRCSDLSINATLLELKRASMRGQPLEQTQQAGRYFLSVYLRSI
jgi:hypothetical protein